jgi:hypothetical protein
VQHEWKVGCGKWKGKILADRPTEIPDCRADIQSLIAIEKSEVGFD